MKYSRYLLNATINVVPGVIQLLSNPIVVSTPRFLHLHRLSVPTLTLLVHLCPWRNSVDSHKKVLFGLYEGKYSVKIGKNFTSNGLIRALYGASAGRITTRANVNDTIHVKVEVVMGGGSSVIGQSIVGYLSAHQRKNLGIPIVYLLLYREIISEPN